MSRCMRLLVIASSMAVISGCASAPKPLYTWNGFAEQQYKVLKQEADSPDNQIRMMRSSADAARGSGLALPPGFRAHLGMLYLQTGNAGAAVSLWEAEKKSFPESGPYMDRVIDRAKGDKQ